MSLDPSLKSASSLVRHRNVLKRSERIERLADLGKWDEKTILGLPKVANRKAAIGGKSKKEEAPEAEGDAKAAKGKK
jgi:small basic protein (TIGR04137 family)